MLTLGASDDKMNPDYTRSLGASDWSTTYQDLGELWLIGQTKVKWKVI